MLRNRYFFFYLQKSELECALKSAPQPDSLLVMGVSTTAVTILLSFGMLMAMVVVVVVLMIMVMVSPIHQMLRIPQL